MQVLIFAILSFHGLERVFLPLVVGWVALSLTQLTLLIVGFCSKGSTYQLTLLIVGFRSKSPTYHLSQF